MQLARVDSVLTSSTADVALVVGRGSHRPQGIPNIPCPSHCEADARISALTQKTRFGQHIKATHTDYTLLNLQRVNRSSICSTTLQFLFIKMFYQEVIH
ncbi:hypothetical protein FKM82_013746 [Ascaphus truei]